MIYFGAMTPEEGRKIFEECHQKFIQNLEDNHALDKAAKILLQEIEAYETKCFNHSGEIIYSTPLVAHTPRLKAIELLIQIYGLKAPEKHEIGGTIAHKLELDPEDRALLRAGVDNATRRIVEEAHMLKNAKVNENE